jgi:prevent-host-death family protein
MINLREDIHPLSDFRRRTPQFVRKLKETGRPMVLTLNGRPELVVLDATVYQRLLTRLEEPERQEQPRGECKAQAV